MSSAVEEFLRFLSPVQIAKPRFVRRDVDLGGVIVKKGAGPGSRCALTTLLG